MHHQANFQLKGVGNNSFIIRNIAQKKSKNIFCTTCCVLPKNYVLLIEKNHGKQLNDVFCILTDTINHKYDERFSFFDR